MQWAHKGSPPPQEGKAQFFVGKMLATVFWETQEILSFKYRYAKIDYNNEKYTQKYN